jgi:mono/diheme cytochrome c family protein
MERTNRKRLTQCGTWFALTAVSALAGMFLVGCGDSTPRDPADESSSFTPPPRSLPGTEMPESEQRPGDPAKGYDALLTKGYVSCGVPFSVYKLAFGEAPEWLRLAGRTGKNETLPYYYTAFTTTTGVDVVAPNCLVCHGATFKKNVVVGLGQHASDYTGDPSIQAEAVGALLSDPAEKLEWRKWADRVKALAPFIQRPTRGPTPADSIAAVLIAHRDQDTLAWSKEPLLGLPPAHVIPVDVPPWWRMSKKNAMFYTAAGQGDHARIMMSASTLCTDSVEEAEAIDAYFPDVRAYLYSLKPPAYDGEIAQEKVVRGEALFGENCARCHGVYGPEGSYPNLLIAMEDVGTDKWLATGAAQYAEEYVTWFNGSFYGQLGTLEPLPGYMAPPLDGIWMTAPYLHNGAVPNLWSLLHSPSRPERWQRSFDDGDFDEAFVGWRFLSLDAAEVEAASPSDRLRIYDTTVMGYGNGGHVYGDTLSDDDRWALIEYLKTL